MCALLGSVLLFFISLTAATELLMNQPGWSQFQPPLEREETRIGAVSTVVDPRAERLTNRRSRALV